MASGLYQQFRQEMMTADTDLIADDTRVILIDTADYTVDLATHDFLDDVAGAARVATSSAMTSKSGTGGVFDAADVVLSSVSGDASEALIIYKHTGTESTSTLIAYIDGISVTPNGGNITIQWDSGANKIFAIPAN